MKPLRSTSRLKTNKWKKLLKQRWAFSWIPFADFALVAGSLAMGEEHEDSDFDIILGCKKGRLFTARFFTILIFGVLGIRRKKTHSKAEASDTFCFNHFVTPVSYTLRPPYNAYWKTLYQNLVPIYGNEEDVMEFFFANQWAGEKCGGSTSEVEPPQGRMRIIFDNRFQKKSLHLLRSPLEWVLKTPIGTLPEYLLMRWQLKRILSTSEVDNIPESRLHVDKNELELHPDTSRINGWLKK